MACGAGRGYANHSRLSGSVPNPRGARDTLPIAGQGKGDLYSTPFDLLDPSTLDAISRRRRRASFKSYVSSVLQI
jgi:hypothetical protein